MQINNTVVKHSTGITHVNPVSKAAMAGGAHTFHERKALLEHYDQIDKSAEKSEQEYNKRQVTSSVIQRGIMESRIPGAINTFTQAVKESIFKDVLYEMFSASLWINEGDKIRYEQSLRSVIEGYVVGSGGYSLLEKAYTQSKSKYLRQFKKVCESVASSVAMRKMQEIREGKTEIDDLSFTLNSDEREQLDYEKEKLSIEDLSDMVKKKVLTVIQDEKQRQQKEEELYQDLEQQASDAGVTVEEAMRTAVIKPSPIEESTLFNALMRQSAMENVTTVTGNAWDDGDDDGFEHTNDEDLMFADDVNSDINDIVQSEEDDDTESGIIGLDQDEGDVDFDVVLSEALTKYSLMELMYTIKLENYTSTDIQNLSRKLLAASAAK